jgi:riboflavin kinase, archaea type
LKVCREKIKLRATMRGKILSGLGQAQYFLVREGYTRQFVEKLGFIPFPGTLNVLLDEPFPVEQEAIKIEGFAEEGRTFGECKCYRIKLNGMQAAVVRPERSRYPPDLIEVIAPVQLRRALGLEDGDPVDVILL